MSRFRRLKKFGNEAMRLSGHLIPSEHFQDYMIKHLSPYLLDPSVLANEYVARPIRGTSTSWLCNPYQFPHRRPFWFGRLESIPLENFVRHHLSTGDTFVDIGANCGQYSVLASDLVGPSGRVLAFEPAVDTFRLLSRHVERLGLSNVWLSNTALGDQITNLPLHVQTAALGCSSFRALSDETNSVVVEECAVVPGDSLLPDEVFPGRTTIKIDVEGYELQVIRGMLSTIRERAHAVLVEVSPSWIGGGRGIEEMWSLFASIGFEARKIMRVGTWGKTLQASDIPLECQSDVVFVPNGDAH